MKLRHIHVEEYKVFHNFDIDFTEGGKTQNLIVVTSINGNGKTTLFRDVIADTDASQKPNCTITIEDDNDVVAFLLPLQEKNERYTEAFSKVRFYPTGDHSSIDQLQKEIVGYVDKFVYEFGKTSFDAYIEIQRMLDDIFSGFNMQIRFKSLNREKKLIFINARQEEFGIDGLSSGELQILSKFFVLFTDDVKGHVILIDEPESSLHPSWQTRILPVLRRCSEMNDCQIIVATQSPQVIAAAHKDEIRFFNRNNEGYVDAEVCSSSPYGWTVEKVLTEIQGVKSLRVPEIEERLTKLKRLIEENKYETDEFRVELSKLECILGYSDQDLVLIRMEVLRKKKKA